MVGFTRILSSMAYAVQLLVMECMFLSFYPRKKNFLLRLLPFALAALLISEFTFAERGSQLRIFVLLLMIIAVSAVGMSFSFEVSYLTVLSSCSSAVALQHIAHHASILMSIFLKFPWGSWLEYAWAAGLTILFWLCFRDSLKRMARFPQTNIRITAISFGIVLICTGLTRFTRMSTDYESILRICVSIYSIICCMLALMAQYYLYSLTKAETENAVFQRIRAEEHKQFNISKDASERLHIIYHDLKHKLKAMEQHLPQGELDEMKQALNTYGAVYSTGLNALDVVLTEKSLYAQAKGITLTFMGNGEDLKFMDEMDIYSLFGNLLDNAITAVDKLYQSDQKLISLVVEHKGNFVNITTTNYYGETPLSFHEGLPETTKDIESGFHGYGLRSVRRIARKYDGDLNVSVSDGIFRAVIYMIGRNETKEA